MKIVFYVHLCIWPEIDDWILRSEFFFPSFAYFSALGLFGRTFEDTLPFTQSDSDENKDTLDEMQKC